MYHEEDTSVEVIWKPQPGPQTRLLSCPAAEIFFGGARGGGKSEALIGDLIQHGNSYGKYARALIIRKELNDLKDLKRRMLEYFIPLGAVYKTQERTFYFPSGFTVILAYLDNEDDYSRYHGQEYTYIGIDEVGQFSDFHVIKMLKSCLRSSKGVPTRLVLTGNPGGVGDAWLKERYIDPATPGTPIKCPISGEYRVFIRSTAYDNKILLEKDPNYINKLIAMGPYYKRIWVDGEFGVVVDGDVFDRERFSKYSKYPKDNQIHLIQCWDTAYKDKHKTEKNDRCVCTTWGITDHGYYLLDFYAARLDFSKLTEDVLVMAKKWQCREVLIEDAASGRPLIDVLEALEKPGFAVRAVKPLGSKEARAWAITPLIDQGLVYIPEEARWLDDYTNELMAFPKGKHDDAVDSTTHALGYIKDKYPISEGALDIKTKLVRELSQSLGKKPPKAIRREFNGWHGVRKQNSGLW